MSTGVLWCSDEFVIPFQLVAGSVGPCSTLTPSPLWIRIRVWRSLDPDSSCPPPACSENAPAARLSGSGCSIGGRGSFQGSKIFH